MFIEINGKYLNTRFISSMKQEEREIDGQTKYVNIYALVNGSKLEESFNTKADADEKYEEVEKSGGGGGPSTNVYVYKGSCLFAELPENNTVGDVWNVEDDFELGGKTYYAGTNVAWKGDGWDALAGSIDVSVFETKSNKVTSMSSESTDTQYPSAKSVWSALSNLDVGLKSGNWKLMFDSGDNKNIILDNLQPGIYFCGGQQLTNWYIKRKSNSSGSEIYTFNSSTWQPYIFILNRKTSGVTFESLTAVGYIIVIGNNTGKVVGSGVYINPNGSLWLEISSYAEQSVVSIYARLLTLGAQTIGGVKTFSSIPKQSNTTAPTDNAEFTNKKYVDDQVLAAATQYTTMPTASATNLGKVVQFIGTTDANYTNGYFYQCVSDGQDPATYSWLRISVQPESDMSNYLAKDNTTAFTPSADYHPSTKKYVDDAISAAVGDIETVVDAILNGSANAENQEF